MIYSGGVKLNLDCGPDQIKSNAGQVLFCCILIKWGDNNLTMVFREY